MSRQSVAVIGVGHHGRHHARILAGMPEVDLVAVVDPCRANAETVAKALGVAALSDPRELVGKVDAAVIAVPTVHHHAVARPLLEAGASLLIEKPLAFSVEESADLVRLARKHRAVVQVGHVERYNPCWTMIAKSGVQPLFVSAERFSRYPFRSLDVSVIFDVMIHDLDLVLAAVGAPVQSVDAVGRRMLSPSLDRVEAWLTFQGGARAMVAASRVHHETVRRFRVEDAESTLDADLFRKTMTVQCKAPSALSMIPSSGFAPTMTQPEKDAWLAKAFVGETTTLTPAGEPLALELTDFLTCVAEGRTPACDVEAGHLAVSLAAKIEEKAALGDRLPTLLRRSA
jgi:predicted dehydrogenase